MNLTKHTILPLLALMLTLFIACSDEEVVTVPDGQSDGLHITLSLSGKQPLYAKADKQTRATIEGENSLNENTVSTVHFFLFNPTVDDEGNVSWKYQKQWSFPEDGGTITQNPDANDDDDETATPDYPTQYFTLQSGKDWRTTLEIVQAEDETKAGSRLYAIANLPEGTDVTGIDTWEDFCALAVTDADIYKKHTSSSGSIGTQEQTGKLFLMDGYYEFTTTKDATDNGNPYHQVTVDLHRAAAKVRVNIYKSANWTTTVTDGSTTTTKNVTLSQNYINKLKAEVANYAIRTLVITPKDDNKPYDTAPQEGYVQLAASSRTGQTGFTPAVATEKDTNGNITEGYVTSVFFYTFFHEWKSMENVGRETSFILNLPYEGREENWYKIVFLPDGKQAFSRNTLYDVDVTVAYDGSVTSYEPVPVSPKYKVSEWKTEEFPVNNNPAVDYLILDRYFIDMRNEADTTITFYSSNYVTVEVVDDQAAEVDSLMESFGKAFPYPVGFNEADYEGTPVTTVSGVAEIPGIYYVDKEGRRVPIYSSSVSLNTQNSFVDLNRAEYKPITVVRYKEDDKTALISDEEGTAITAGTLATKEDSEVYITWPGYKTDHSQNGLPISIHSAIPRNLTPRYITLRVTMPKMYGTGYIVRYVIIKQYPLEYVVNRFGLASYIDAPVLNANADAIVNHNGSRKEGTTSHWNFQSGAEVPTEIVEILEGHIAATSNHFRAKFFVDGTAQTFSTYLDVSQYQREDAEGVHNGNIYYAYDYDGDNKNISQQSAFNNRMYEVRITVTSPEYRIGYPKLEGSEDDIYAETSKLNAELVSPHFMLASQLGNCSATPNWATAHDHCLHYVEVESVTDPDGNVRRVYHEDWRLPTLAELNLLKTYQIDDDVFNVTMNRVLNSDGDSDPRYWSSAEDWYLDTTGDGGEVYQTRGTDTYSWPDAYTGYYKGKTDITKPSDTNTRIRIRCVRDVKNE